MGPCPAARPGGWGLHPRRCLPLCKAAQHCLLQFQYRCPLIRPVPLQGHLIEGEAPVCGDIRAVMLVAAESRKLRWACCYWWDGYSFITPHAGFRGDPETRVDLEDF